MNVNGGLKYQENGTKAYDGYHTIKLSKEIPIARGDNVSVVMMKNVAPIIENSMQHYQKNTSFLIINNQTEDLAEKNKTVSLKMYTKDLAIYSNVLEKIYKNESQFEVNVGEANQKIVFEIDKGVIDLNFDDDVMRLEYPMKSPVSFTLGEKFLQEKLIFSFIIMSELGNKYKKLAKGDIELQSKYFLEKKTIFEKWVYMTPFQSQIEEFGIQEDALKNELNCGKINVKIELQENLEEYKTKLLLYQKENQNKL